MEGHNLANAAVQQSWINSLFLHFIGWFQENIPSIFFYLMKICRHHVAFLFAISIGIFHCVRYYYNGILSLKKTNYLMLFFCGWMTIMVITDYTILQSIKNEMESLGPGGIVVVNTNPESGSSITIHPG